MCGAAFLGCASVCASFLCVPKSCRCFKRSTFHVWKVGSVTALVSMKVVKLIKNRRMKSVNLAFRIFAHGKQACFGLSRLSFAAAKTETEKSQRIRQVTKGRRMPKAEGATQFNREVPSNASNASHRLSFNISAPGLIALMLFLSIMTSHCKTLNKTPKMQENSLEIQQKHKLLRASDLWNHGTG